MALSAAKNVPQMGTLPVPQTLYLKQKGSTRWRW